MPDFDANTPSVARLYDAALGGKDNRESDRELAAKVLRENPFLMDVVKANREFVIRAVTWAAEQGIGQFIDLGSGMPAEPATHETARAVNPEARVVYVDLDPVAVGNMRALYESVAGVRAMEADLRDPAATLDAVAADGGVDVTAPVCVIMGALVHWFDTTAARDLVARFTTGLAPGSYVAASTVTGHGETADSFARAFNTLETPLYLRSLDEFTGLFDGLELVPPGLAEIQAWRPGEAPSHDELPSRELWGYVLVARA